MTIIIAKNTKNEIILGSDTANFHCESTTKTFNKKIIICNNNIIFAGCGSTCLLRFFRDYINYKKVVINNLIDLKDFIDNFRKSICDNKEHIENGAIFFVVKNKLYKIVELNFVYEIKEESFMCVGQGNEIAYALNEVGCSVEKILQTVIKICTYTGGEPDILKIEKKNANRS